MGRSGGSIQVDSEPGMGTRIRLYLPLAGEVAREDGSGGHTGETVEKIEADQRA